MNTAILDQFKKECTHLYPFEINNDFFLLDTESLNVASISKDTHDVINMIIKNPSSPILNNFDELCFEELFYFVQDPPAALLKDTSSIPDRNRRFATLKTMKTLTLVVCEACNLRCEYCYLRQKLDKKAFMDKETCRRAINLFFKHAGQYVHIDFYGGEPLLNFDIIKFATKYALREAKKCGINLSFSCATNGTICNDEILNHLIKYNFLISISLDGPPKIHNRFRKFKSGELTFDVIMNNINEYFSHYDNKEILRFTPTIFCEYYDQLELIYGFFRELENKYGISFNAFGDIQFMVGETLFSSNSTESFCKMLLDYGKLILEEAEIEGNMIKLFTKIRIPVHFFKAIFRKKMISSKCGAGVTSMVVYPDGSITGCRQFDSSIVRNFNLSWGNVFSDKFNDELRLLPIIPVHTTLPKQCKGCFIKNMCTNVCPGLAYCTNGNFIEPDQRMCEINKTFCKLSIWLAAKALEKKFSLTNELLDYRITSGLRGGRDERHW